MGSSFLFTAPGAKIRKAPVIRKKKMASAGWWVLYSVLGIGKARLAGRACMNGVYSLVNQHKSSRIIKFTSDQRLFQNHFLSNHATNCKVL